MATCLRLRLPSYTSFVKREEYSDLWESLICPLTVQAGCELGGNHLFCFTKVGC